MARFYAMSKNDMKINRVPILAVYCRLITEREDVREICHRLYVRTRCIRGLSPIEYIHHKRCMRARSKADSFQVRAAKKDMMSF